MYPSVKTVTPKEDYILYITFNNNESGILDMKPYLAFGIFKRIENYNNFRNVRVAFDTIEWSSVGVDLDPEFVYQKCKKVSTHSALAADKGHQSH
ncbi:DUF2442 domain-containing protein [Candidatus Venteria ishoeyi]|uniref:DUF2442 domain-containing protein n=1 Tax=Candidatus Venteria ishoeyi TaxID=1899563 RepID=UPI0025A60EBB|nr:DUF2442 domain-containing protein [Candidatus Venteria ishoeyi]MDM8548189.1 DUF2442 domain-containing protein [Candidatus Venteria ishoeyi]